MMTPTQKRLHDEHLARKARLYAAAYIPPPPPPPPPVRARAPAPTRAAPPPRPKVFAAKPKPKVEIIKPGDNIAEKSLDRILHEVCIKHMLCRLQIADRNERDRSIIDARYEYYYRSRKETNHTYKRIGLLTGHDRTNVMHGVRQHAFKHSLPPLEEPNVLAAVDHGEASKFSKVG